MNKYKNKKIYIKSSVISIKNTKGNVIVLGNKYESFKNV